MDSHPLLQARAIDSVSEWVIGPGEAWEMWGHIQIPCDPSGRARQFLR